MLAILSNTNCDPIIRKVSKRLPCLESVGYGNVLEDILNPASKVFMEKPDIVLLLIDTREYIQNSPDYRERIDLFFAGLEHAANSETRYYISDAYYYLGCDGDQKGTAISRRSELYWNQRLLSSVDAYGNFYVFPFRRCVEAEGEASFFSDTAWRLGSVRYSASGIARISLVVAHMADIAAGKIKKVLLLDLDNTLWGGVAGEDGIDGIKLADSQIGKAYKEFQSELCYMKECGTALAIVSKNNEEDAWEIIDNHPHMLLHRNDFAAYRINWESKATNIQELAVEMNVGTDSMVFVDDNPAERQEVRDLLPDVVVPEFPEKPEELPRFGRELLETWFQKAEITAEDREKTIQYQAMRKIADEQAQAKDFLSFLRGLRIKVIRCDPKANFDRVVQLVQKTNQFNTTVIRYTQSELERMLSDERWRVFLYRVEDRFAKHGLCALAFISVSDIPVIENFIMSCRVMGRNIEYGILEDIERSLVKEGHSLCGAIYRRGPKNSPVEALFEKAGFEIEQENHEEKIYRKEILLTKNKNLFIGRMEVS